MAAAKQKILTMASNFEFCEESFGTSVANVETTVMPSTLHNAMET